MLAGLTQETRAALNWRWEFWARQNQLPPDGDWRSWLFVAGRGSGKTRAGAEFIRSKIKQGLGRVSLIAPTSADARDVMVEGESGLLSVCWENDKTITGATIGRPVYEPSKRRVTWANGAQASLFSAEEPERLRGPQFEASWCDEFCAWTRMQDTWDMAMLGLRLGRHPQVIATTTPKPSKLLRSLLHDKRTVVTRGSTFDNAPNLSQSFLDAIKDKLEGTRLGRQELYGELLEDVPGALWTPDMVKTGPMPEMARIVVAVDPSGASGVGKEISDDIGIVIVGKGVDGRFYVIEDATCHMSPEGWGRRTVDRFHAHRADLIVAERNFGGDMVASVIRTADQNAPVKLVTASRGKSVRAQPVSALYEQGRVTHALGLDALEDQMMSMTASGFIGDGSPDRLDAMVWGISELMSGSAYTLENI